MQLPDIGDTESIKQLKSMLMNFFPSKTKIVFFDTYMTQEVLNCLQGFD